MPEPVERRGPIEKGPKGWPINPLGVFALVIFALIIVFLIIRPLVNRTNILVPPGEETSSQGGRIITPQAGEIIKGDVLTIELEVDEPENVEKVQFWLKTYVDGNWQMIGEVTSSPFRIEWPLPPEVHNKAVALTSHIYKKGGDLIKDPGGWREGIIILSQ